MVQDASLALADRLAAIDGVAAVALGGSRATGTASDDSDTDLGIYYEPDSPPSIAELNALAGVLDDRHEQNLVTEIGEWGPWINGGGWLTIEGRRVDWLFRDLSQVRRAIDDCTAGRITCHYQSGHPHGFHNHMYMAEVHIGRILHDPTGTLGSLKARTDPYPAALKVAIVRKYAWEASFSLGTAQKPAARGDVAYVSGCLFRTIACLVQVLFALNERYFLNEKRSVTIAANLPATPLRLGDRVDVLLGKPGADPDELLASLAAAEALLADVRVLCPRDLIA